MRTLLILTFLATPAAADPTIVDSDVSLIINGHFAVDHIGPKLHGEITKRALAEPREYLLGIERAALRITPQYLSSAFIPDAISWIGATVKPEAKAVATRLLPVFKRVRATPAPASDPYRDARLDQRIADLVALSR